VFYLQGTFVLVGAVLVARAVESQNAGLVLSLAATNATGIIVVGTVDGGPIARWHRWGAFRERSDGRRGRQHGDPGGICHRSERRHTALDATWENPTRAPTDAVVISASVAALVGRRVPLSAGSKAAGEAEVAAAVGIGSVAAASLVVHSVFTVRYARLYYRKWFERNRFQPRRRAAGVRRFRLTSHSLRHDVSSVRHRFESPHDPGHRVAPGPVVVRVGAVILATTINLVAGLSSVSS
jgi:hypothetical protein